MVTIISQKETSPMQNRWKPGHETIKWNHNLVTDLCFLGGETIMPPQKTTLLAQYAFLFGGPVIK